MPEQPISTAKRSRAIIAAAAVAAVVTGAAIYGIGAMQRNVDPACTPSAELAKRLAPLARGEVAAINIATEPQKLPDLTFKDASGEPRKLADFKGRTVLLNLWATWCVPCRKEMPALDALQTKLGDDKFQVVAVNIDTRNLEKPKACSTRSASRGSATSPIRAPRCFRISRRSARHSACRPRCSSTRRAASSGSSRVPPNGRATTQSS